MPYKENHMTLEPLPPGDAGVDRTVARIRPLVESAALDPAVKKFAYERVLKGPKTDPSSDIFKVARFIRRNWSFMPDPPGIELVKTPRRQIHEFNQYGYFWGDCDDASLLAAGIYKALGYENRFVVVQRKHRSGKFDHIFIEIRYNDDWIAFDPVARGMPLFLRPASIREKSYA